jgi:hypothetical protein
LRLRVRLAAACGADEQGVAATTAATGVAAVAVPALFVYVCLPLLHAGQEVMDGVGGGPPELCTVDKLVLLLVCACVACCCA